MRKQSRGTAQRRREEAGAGTRSVWVGRASLPSRRCAGAGRVPYGSGNFALALRYGPDRAGRADTASRAAGPGRLYRGEVQGPACPAGGQRAVLGDTATSPLVRGDVVGSAGVSGRLGETAGRSGGGQTAGQSRAERGRTAGQCRPRRAQRAPLRALRSFPAAPPLPRIGRALGPMGRRGGAGPALARAARCGLAEPCCGRWRRSGCGGR